MSHILVRFHPSIALVGRERKRWTYWLERRERRQGERQEKVKQKAVISLLCSMTQHEIVQHVLFDESRCFIRLCWFELFEKTFYSVNSFEEIFNRVKPNTVLEFLAKMYYKNDIIQS